MDYLERTLAACCEALDLPFHPLRSSSLAIDPALRAQDRILAICERLGASAYVNAPGGVDLYDGEAFAARGVALAFLTPWQGSYGSVLERLLSEDPRSVGEGIRRETVLVPAGSAAPGGEAAAA